MNRYRRKYEQVKIRDILMKWAIDIIVVIGIALFLVIYLGESSTVVGYSMEPTLLNGDRILINKLEYGLSSPKRYDIVVFQPNIETSHYYIKRIIGLPGEKLEIKNGLIYINDEKLTEPMELDSIISPGLAEKEIVLGSDEYFLLGDNRNNSEDSRFSNVGNVKHHNIIGKVWLLFSSFSDIRLIE